MPVAPTTKAVRSILTLRQDARGPRRAGLLTRAQDWLPSLARGYCRPSVYPASPIAGCRGVYERLRASIKFKSGTLVDGALFARTQAPVTVLGGSRARHSRHGNRPSVAETGSARRKALPRVEFLWSGIGVYPGLGLLFTPAPERRVAIRQGRALHIAEGVQAVVGLVNGGGSPAPALAPVPTRKTG